MPASQEFTLTEQHLALLRRAYVGWEDCEFGAPAIDCKRPYGNSSVENDIAEILGWPVDDEDGPTRAQRERAAVIHAETQTALQIILATGDMTPGAFRRTEQYNSRSWERINAGTLSSSGALDTPQGEEKA